MALPATLAQLINVLYSVVDRIYIGHMDGVGGDALTGLGLVVPVITIITAFANLCGMGGAPLFAMARGRGDVMDAKRVMGNSLTLLLIAALLVTVACEAFLPPILWLFGASVNTFAYALGYARIYVLGTAFVLISVGMNGFINAQGFPKVGMFTVLIGAVANALLDPFFIFALNLGIRGAALATLIAQGISALWVLRFLTGDKGDMRLSWTDMHMQIKTAKKILTLGLTGFIMSVTNGLVLLVCNTRLQLYGGDLYVGVMTVLSSVREIIYMPVHGLASGAQPVIAYNYGAKSYSRVRAGIRFVSLVSVAYSLLAWALVMLSPEPLIRMFNDDESLVAAGVSAMRTYFCCFCFMSLQMSGQMSFLSTGQARGAITFSILRKVVIVIPMTFILPTLWGMGVNGVFWAESISNLVGGALCYTVMILTVYRKMPTGDEKRQ